MGKKKSTASPSEETGVKEYKEIYLYHKKSGAYIGPADGNEDQIHAYTEIKPPMVPDGDESVQVFKNGTWSLIKTAILEETEKQTAKRDRLLSSTDWTQLADSPVDKEIWAEYRQKLRDLNKQEGFPTTTEWPEIPELVTLEKEAPRDPA